MEIILKMDVPQSLIFSAYKRYIKSYYRHYDIKLTSEILDEHIIEIDKYFKDKECEKSEFFVSFLTFYGIHIENIHGEKTEHERKI